MSDHQESAMEIPQAVVCPSCGQKGRPVKTVTLRSLVRAEIQVRITDGKYRYCPSPQCDVVYYAEDGSNRFEKSELSVRVGIKETDAPRPVCYCFDHTIEEIEGQVERTGKCTVLDDIKARMQDGCWCETKNPQGSCCLGAVNEQVKAAQAKFGVASADGSQDQFEDCCADESGDAATTGKEAPAATDGGRWSLNTWTASVATRSPA